MELRMSEIGNLQGKHDSQRGVTTVEYAIMLVLVAIFAPWLVDFDPSAIAGEALRAPTARHPFGTDDLGRDVFAGVVHGARTSLLVGSLAAALAGILGLLVGGMAASIRCRTGRCGFLSTAAVREERPFWARIGGGSRRSTTK